MRIVLWSNSFWPHIGGVEVLGRHFATALTDRGHDVLVVVNRDDPDLPAHSELGGVRIARVAFEDAITRRDPKAILVAQREAVKIRTEFGPEVEHLYHGQGGEISCFAFTAARSQRPYLVSLHMSYRDEHMAPGSTLRSLLGRAIAVTTCSDAVREQLIRQAPELARRTWAIANSLPSPVMEPTPLPFDPPVLFAAGRFTTQKGFDVALDAIALLDCRPHLVIAGAGVEGPALEERKRALGLEDSVTFAGWVAPDDMPLWMNRATAVLMPSRWEPFGLVALQAAQMARPVIASSIDGLREVVVHGETGLLVPPDDPAALADAIAALLGDPNQAAAMGRAAQQRARETWPWVRHVDAYEKLYTQVLAQALHPS